MKRKAVFFDRDGTINLDSGYISKPEDFNVYPFAGKAIKKLNDAGFLVIVVTNQSGVARGYYTFDDLEKIHNKMLTQLKQDNAKVDKIYLSPYHIEGHIEPFNINHEERKPNTGMFKKACKEFDIDIENSYMVGDRKSDIDFAYNSGLTPILVLTGDGKKLENKPKLVAKNILQAVDFILAKQS